MTSTPTTPVFLAAFWDAVRHEFERGDDLVPLPLERIDVRVTLLPLLQLPSGIYYCQA